MLLVATVASHISVIEMQLFIGALQLLNFGECQHSVYLSKCCFSIWSVGLLLSMGMGQLHTCQRAHQHAAMLYVNVCCVTLMQSITRALVA